jgi:hypothetical protein
MGKVIQYGLQRTGTNYVEFLIKKNFNNFVSLNNGATRSLPLHKHFRLYDDKSFIPTPEYMNNFNYSSFNEFDGHVKELTGEESFDYLVVTKEPVSWYISLCKFAKKNKWKILHHKHVDTRYLIDYNLFHEKWLDFANQSNRITILRYEDFLSDLDASLDSVKETFQLQKKGSRYENLDKVPMSKKFNKKKRSFYKDKKYQELFDKNKRLIIKNILDKKVVEGLGYEMID